MPIPFKPNTMRRWKSQPTTPPIHNLGNRWVCMECKKELGPKRVVKCPFCGSEETENVG